MFFQTQFDKSQIKREHPEYSSSQEQKNIPIIVHESQNLIFLFLFPKEIVFRDDTRAILSGKQL